MPCQDMVLNFLGRWIRRAFPTSGFSNFVTLNRFGVAGAPLSHFSHVQIVRSTCRHFWRLRPRLWYLRFGIRCAQLTDCSQFFSTVLRVVQAHSAWYSALSRGFPPTEIRRRPVLKFPRPQDEDSIFACSGMRCTPVIAFLTDATPAHEFGSMKDPLPSSKTTMLPLSITPDTASKGLRTLAPWNVIRLEMSPPPCVRCELLLSILQDCLSFQLQGPRIVVLSLSPLTVRPVIWTHN